MNDEQELQRDLDLIRSVADRGVMEIEAARRELEALMSRQVSPPTASAPERPAAAPSTDLEEDDFYQFGGSTWGR